MCRYIHAHTHTHMHAYIHIHTYIHTYIYISVHTMTSTYLVGVRRGHPHVLDAGHASSARRHQHAGRKGVPATMSTHDYTYVYMSCMYSDVRYV
jgi:hypothetical protein